MPIRSFYLREMSASSQGVFAVERCIPYKGVYLTGVFAHQEFLLPKRGVCCGKDVLYKGVCLTGVFAYKNLYLREVSA